MHGYTCNFRLNTTALETLSGTLDVPPGPGVPRWGDGRLSRCVLQELRLGCEGSAGMDEGRAGARSS